VHEEVRLYPDTTEHHFARWLRDHISRSLPSPYEAEDGARIYLERASVPYRDGFSSRIDIAATGTARAGSVPMGIAISFRYMQHRPGTIEVVVRCHLLEAMTYFQALLAAMEERWPQGWAKTRTGAAVHKRQRPTGRPGLDDDELLYRLAKAQEAEEIRRADPEMWWKAVAKEINWRYGISERGLALLRDARKRLHRLEESDPDGLLQEVEQRRRARKTKET